MSMGGVRKIKTICPFSPCPSYDGIVATVEDGRITKIEGACDEF